MPITAKPGIDREDRPLNQLPDMPVLASLSPEEHATLTDWWRQVREVLERGDRVIRDEIDQLKSA